MYSAIVFDMDGVLVDVRRSYQTAVVETVRILCAEARCVAPAPSGDWVRAMKGAGGFNNDWDLSRALVRGCLIYGSDFNIDSFASQLQERGGGIQAVDTLLGPPPPHPVLAPDPLAGDRVKRVFQEAYLGAGLFESIHGGVRETVSAPAQGLIDDETPILEPPVLAALSKRPLGLATGRPRTEAEYTLDRFGILSFFGVRVTHDDAVAAGQRGKPDPWVLQEARRRLGLDADARIAYVGDLPDDMLAAVGAGFDPVGFCADSADQSSALKNAGARVVCHSSDELKTLFLDAH